MIRLIWYNMNLYEGAERIMRILYCSYSASFRFPLYIIRVQNPAPSLKPTTNINALISNSRLNPFISHAAIYHSHDITCPPFHPLPVYPLCCLFPTLFPLSASFRGSIAVADHQRLDSKIYTRA